MQENTTNPTIKGVLKEYNDEMKHHIKALSEDFHSQIKVIGEQYSSIQDTLTSHTEMTGSIMENIEIIKMDIEFIKSGLKRKVDIEEFTALERRVTFLEGKRDKVL